MRILIDGMGGDNAPAAIVEGVVEASKLVDETLCIVGIEEDIRRELGKYSYDEDKIEVVPASQVIENEDSPVRAVRTKKDSSMVKAMNMVKSGEGDLLISAGNSGALMAGGLFIFGRIPGIDRPAIASVYPIFSGGMSLLIDAGANSECRPSNLMDFATMGSIYLEKVMKVEAPRVGLVNIGVEENKGSALTKETYGLLENSQLNFVGNVEAREIPAGACDVIVCDGFVGNVILKLSEGLAINIGKLLKEKLMDGIRATIGALFLKKKMGEIKQLFDYSEYGGAPILGVQGALIKIHGSSKSNSVKNAIIKGIPYAKESVVELISEAALKNESPTIKTNNMESEGSKEEPNNGEPEQNDYVAEPEEASGKE